MKRYTAMRTSLIASAVAWPLSVVIIYLNLVYDLPGKYYWLSFCGALMLIQYAPVLCVDPATEIDSAAPRRGKAADMKAWIIGFVVPLLIYWLLYQPNVRTFLSEIKPLLRDWKPTTVLVLLCLQIMLKRLRKALTFKVTDLYPHLRRVEKTESR